MNEFHPTEKELITVGETPLTHEQAQIAAYVLPENKELNMVFNFELMDLDSPTQGEGLLEPIRHSEWKLSELRDIVNRWQVYKREEGFWNAYVEFICSPHISCLTVYPQGVHREP